MGMKGRVGSITIRAMISEEEIKAAINMLKVGRAPCVDGRTAEMLNAQKVEWMHKIYVWGKVKGYQMQGPLYNGKAIKMSKNYEGIGLLSIPEKV